jgi:N-acetylmuramoyl-L-alanine amidase
MNFFLIAGHSKAKPGATAFNDKSEHFYTKELQGLIIHEIFKRIGGGSGVVIKADDESDDLRDVVLWINQVSKPGDIGLDIHFNNNNPAATGTEVFVNKKTSEANKALATRMVNNISEAFGYKLRRAEPKRDYKFSEESNPGKLTIVDGTKIPFILIEVCFLNEFDLKKYNPEIAAKAIVDAYEFKKL